MRNHFHLAVETPDPNLSEGMKYLQGTWANRFNRFNGVMGRPFQGRYKALHVESGQALAQVAHYIHLNPVRATVVEADKLGDFRWSSFWWFPQKKRPVWLCSETVLAESGGLNDTAAGWRSYAEYLAVLAETMPRKRDERYGQLSRGWALGTAEFKRGLIEELKQRGAELEFGAPQDESPEGRQHLREACWEERLQQLAKAAKIDLGKLGPGKSNPAKVKLAATLKADTGVSNGWLCTRLGMGKPASVSQFVRRWRMAEDND